MLKLVRKRSKQLYEIDVLLFDKIDCPVLIPQNIVDSQKALTKKGASPTKKKGSIILPEGGGQAAMAEPATAGSAKLSPSGGEKSVKNSVSPTGVGARKGKGMGRLLHELHSSAHRRPLMT